MLMEEKWQCPICFEDTVHDDVHFFEECDHGICKRCLKGYLTTKISSAEVLVILCPIPKCTTVISYDQFKESLDPEIFDKYLDFSVRVALQKDAECRFCPRVNCNNAVIACDAITTITCTDLNCGFTWCTICNEEAHPKMTCSKAAKKNRSTLQTKQQFAEWIKKNAKICPNCKVKIEKSEGCNHITCKQCGYDFCYLCGGHYTTSHYKMYNVFGCPGLRHENSEEQGKTLFRRTARRGIILTGLVFGAIVAIPVIILASPYLIAQKYREVHLIRRFRRQRRVIN